MPFIELAGTAWLAQRFNLCSYVDSQIGKPSYIKRNIDPPGTSLEFSNKSSSVTHRSGKTHRSGTKASKAIKKNKYDAISSSDSDYLGDTD